jgi:putative hydrolase of the HAD superfamily
VTRALIFDLDDTLYPERRFALSGYAAVAAHAARHLGVGREEGFRFLARELRHGRRGEAFQRFCALHRLPAGAVVEFRAIYRAHQPALKLPASTRAVLALVRRTWRVGVLTNGLPDVQRRKIAALGLLPLVDCVIFAHEVGEGKPDPAVFRAACNGLSVAPEATVMTGDDPWCDIDGGRRAGLRVIRIRRGIHAATPSGETGPADATAASLTEVPWLAAALVQEGQGHAD